MAINPRERMLMPAMWSAGAQLERLGWKFLPIPQFFAARELWHNPDSTAGNPAFIDFGHVAEWLVVPPETSALPATKIRGGRIRAVRWAFEQATGPRPFGAY